MATIAENIQSIRANIAAALSGDDRAVLLVAATKMNDAQRVREAIAAGVDACGENKVQEFLEKDALGAYDGCPKHFIGHLQRNKVGKSILCYIGLALLIGIVMMLTFQTTSLDSEDVERLLGEVDPARVQTWINVALNVIYAVVFTLLIGGIWARIKTIKA